MEYSKLKFWIGLAVAFILGWGISYFVHTKSVKIEDKLIAQTKESNFSQASSTPSIQSSTDIPSYALETLEYIREHNEPPSGYVGGRNFQNREGQLPKQDNSGQVYRYREWDVHPKVEGQNRGAERLVTSDQGDAYYTSDHYRTFKKIN